GKEDTFERYSIRGENIEVTDAIRNYVEKKIDKLKKYFDTPPASDVHVNLSVYDDEQRIEVTSPMTRLLLRAEAKHADLYAAIDLVVDKMERKIRKYKLKVNRKFKQKCAAKCIFAELENNTYHEKDDDADEIEIVRTKQFDLKPM